MGLSVLIAQLLYREPTMGGRRGGGGGLRGAGAFSPEWKLWREVTKVIIQVPITWQMKPFLTKEFYLFFQKRGPNWMDPEMARTS